LQQRTLDEVEAEIELEEERKSNNWCAESNCFGPRYLFSQYCPTHHDLHVAKLTPEQRKMCQKQLEKVLATLTYREREIIKLRHGIGDGYFYTPSEVGRVLH
jgi:hypothetical protein